MIPMGRERLADRSWPAVITFSRRADTLREHIGSEDGIGLIDVVVAILVLSLLIPALLSVMNTASNASGQTGSQVRAGGLVTQQLSAWQEQLVNENSSTFLSTGTPFSGCNTAATCTGTTYYCGQTTPSSCSTSTVSGPQYTLTSSAAWACEAGQDTGDGNTTPALEVTVTASWTPDQGPINSPVATAMVAPPSGYSIPDVTPSAGSGGTTSGGHGSCDG